jgi:hypothetical protein
MNNITVKVELCDEDRARLDKIIERLGQFVPPNVTIVPPTVSVPTAKDDDLRTKLEAAAALGKTTAAEPAETPQDAPSASGQYTIDLPTEAPTVKAEASEESVKEVTAAELQQLAIALCRKQKQPELRKVLGEYGASKVSEVLEKVPADKLPEVYAKMKALEG